MVQFRQSLPAGCAFFAASLLAAGSSAAGSTVTFPFEDERWLLPGQSEGGAAFLTDGATGDLALVVFLHGVNDSKRLHPRMDGTADDLRPALNALATSGKTPPFVFAGPTQSRDASYAEVLFFGFDLDAFVSKTQAALPSDVRIDRSRVVVVGHSAGACNPSGGLLRVAKKHGAVTPYALVESDGCMDSYVADALKQAAPETRVHVYWQTWMWPRRWDAFKELMNGRDKAVLEELRAPPDFSAHDKVLGLVLDRALPDILR